MRDAEKLKQLEDRRWMIRAKSDAHGLRREAPGNDDRYNAELSTIDGFFDELKKLARTLDEEEARHVREELSEEELRPTPGKHGSVRAHLFVVPGVGQERLRGRLVSA